MAVCCKSSDTSKDVNNRTTLNRTGRRSLWQRSGCPQTCDSGHRNSRKLNAWNQVLAERGQIGILGRKDELLETGGEGGLLTSAPNRIANGNRKSLTPDISPDDSSETLRRVAWRFAAYRKIVTVVTAN